jgi:hypothetical protein
VSEVNRKMSVVFLTVGFPKRNIGRDLPTVINSGLFSPHLGRRLGGKFFPKEVVRT